MNIFINYQNRQWIANLALPLDISIPLKAGFETVNCFYAPPAEYVPFRSGDFVGSVTAGASVNFFDVRLNPHGNGTHTECVGHISRHWQKINDVLTQFHFFAKVITIFPQRTEGGDRVILKTQLTDCLRADEKMEAVIIRTMPNDDLKMRTNYSGANAPYFHHEAMEYLVACGVQHLLTDLPSLDREEDAGKLLAHKAFWQFDGETAHPSRLQATVTELVYVKNEIKDGFYLLNIQIPPFECDAAPSKPVLYALQPIEK
jgi:kynurenine formamidase